ncbi:ABC transporter permease [Paenibacillus septentrionalis]|uniref:ABC transporter permease n=1 Tax=Paenibacillus septentrionalis TaxID=429342 RepID=A0ABW1V4Q2_9BACL
MGALLRVEWFKLWKTNIIPFILLAPAIVFMVAWNTNIDTEELSGSKYLYAAMYANMAYAVMFLPLMTGVLATLICRYEHQSGGWKQLFALPTTRGRVYVAKFTVVSMLTLCMQLLVLLALLLVGYLKQYGEPFPTELLLRGIIGGWVATLPLIALMLWLSTLFQSLAAPFAVNVIFTIPTMLVLNSEKVAPYYPWGQPFLMMYVTGDEVDLFYVPWQQLLTVVGGSFVLFFAIGFIYLQRKEV